MNQPGYDFLPAHGHEVQAVHLFVLTELFNQFKRNLNALFLGVASRVCFFHAPEDMVRHTHTRDFFVQELGAAQRA